MVYRSQRDEGNDYKARWSNMHVYPNETKLKNNYVCLVTKKYEFD